MQTQEEDIQTAFESIAAINALDGFSFTYQGLSPLMQPHMHYPGYRATLQAKFGRIQDRVHIDVGVGDIVTPQSLQVQLFQYRGKPMFENDISLLVYPIETIFAEKLETVISKGAANSRMKDYHDLYLLVREKRLDDPTKLKISLSQTFQNRGTTLQLIKFDEVGLGKLQKLWTAHLNGLGDIAYNLNMPSEISNVIATVNTVL